MVPVFLHACYSKLFYQCSYLQIIFTNDDYSSQTIKKKGVYTVLKHKKTVLLDTGRL